MRVFFIFLFSLLGFHGQADTTIHEQIQVLKQQAVERKEFYDEQAKSRIQLRISHNQKMNELLEHHRTTRAEFSRDKHSAEERKEFFLNQRNEMAELKKRQKEERTALNLELKNKRAQFHARQKSERQKVAVHSGQDTQDKVIPR